MRLNKDRRTKDQGIERNRERLLKGRAKGVAQGNRERAQMEKSSKPKIRMLSGWKGTEKYVQNIWLVLPIEMERTEFKARFNRAFSDVGEI